MRSRTLGTLAVVLLVVAVGCNRPPASPRAAPTASPSAVEPIPSPPVTATAGPERASGRPLHYVALGDSLASGMGGEPSYADAYRRALQRRMGRPVELVNLGRPGWTSGQLLNLLRSDEQVRATVAEADVVSWNIGGNDIIGAVLRTATSTCGGTDGLGCVRATTEEFRGRWRAIIDELVSLRRSPNVPLLTFDLYTPFIPAGARTDAVLGQLAEMNATITASDGLEGVEVAPVARAFAGDGTGRLMSADGLHPSPAGHHRIARLLLRETPAPPP